MAMLVNLVTYLTGTMHLPSSTSANIITDFWGTSFLLCLLGGFLADTFLGRCKTAAIFAAIDALGTGALALSTKLPQLRPPPCGTTASTTHCKQANKLQMGILYMGLYIIALGIGGLKSSVSGFGADQFDEKDEEEKAKRDYFFDRHFFFISIGTLTAVTVLVYLQDKTIIVFLFGTKGYRNKKSLGSPLVHISQVIVAATRKRNMDIPFNVGSLYEDSPEASRIDHTFLNKASIVAEGEVDQINAGSAPNLWKLCSVTRVEEVKMIIRLLPIWATTIVFWTTQAQMITFAVEQASTMDRRIGNFQIPAASLNAFFVAAIMITLAVNDRLIMPLWKKWKGEPGFANLQKIAIGLVLSIFGMVAAALCERKRLSVVKAVGGTTSTLPISVFYLIPQYFLVGSGEGFIYTGQLDYSITGSPKGMKTMSTGLFFTTLAFGYFGSSFLVSVVNKVTGSKNGQGWLVGNINYGRLDYFYALLAVLGAINFVMYLVCAAWCRPTKAKSASIVNWSGAEEKCY
ncbi:hypothetical protein ACB094_01G303700 [Castanea mollissima]